MLRLLDRLLYTYLTIFYLLVSIHGKSKDLFPSCEVRVMVRTGTTWKSVPRRSLTVRCPVRHCGESLNVTWCKIVDTHSCEQIIETENAGAKQSDTEGELISYLTFKWISVYDDGLYRCQVKGYKYNLISHILNISVSDTYQGVETTDNTAAVSLGTAGNEAMSWRPYFIICGSIALLVVTLTALTLLNYYAWKRILYKPTKGQEIFAHAMIPDLPKGSVPSTHVLQDCFFLSNINHPSTAGAASSSPHSLITRGNKPLVNTADASQEAPLSSVYALINYTQTGKPREQNATTKQHKDPEYATISVS